MAIVKILGFFDFVEEFDKMGRNDQFSRDALRELYDYYNDDDFLSIGENYYQLDVINICCDWTEYNKEEFLKHFDINLDDYRIDSEDFDFLKNDEILDDLGHQYIVIDSDSVLVRE